MGFIIEWKKVRIGGRRSDGQERANDHRTGAGYKYVNILPAAGIKPYNIWSGNFLIAPRNSCHRKQLGDYPETRYGAEKLHNLFCTSQIPNMRNTILDISL